MTRLLKVCEVRNVKRTAALLAVVLFLSAGCWGGQKKGGPEAVSLTVAAASSMKDAAEELKTVYTARNPGISIVYNLASSGALQKQIEEGAPVDIFISAGKKQMDALESKGLLMEGSRQNLIGNEIVLIAPVDSRLSGFEDLAGPGVSRIALGSPETVPAGGYSKQALSYLKIWDIIEPRFVLAKDVRQVLTYVETGSVEAGLVFRTDAVAGRNIKLVASAPEGSHDDIVYPLAVIKGTPHLKEAREFTAFLISEEAEGILNKYGFKSIKQ